ncbi:MAG: helix-turn-helix domain-containing protein [Cyclobacteriaceae bacterium]|nr:helix-turn-helix domain-containing protein [Cyclobacteriaceae bacterium HetDA_MAG_MS6]
MPSKIFELRHIFGLKLKELRLEKGITYQELKDKSGLSVSYLSEIESGKKYPKGDKIALLAEALDVSYDDLVSIKVPKKLQPVINLIESDFFKAFPLIQFGLSPQKIIEIISQDPDKTNAFINTIMQIARNYEMKQEHFYYAALRSYLELQNNYFEELEDEVEGLHLEFIELKEVPFQPELLEDILLKIGVRTDYRKLSEFESLKDLRSLYHPRQRLLHINQGLTKGQKNYLLGREIAFQWLKFKKRSLSTPPQGKHDFEDILNNHMASYFAAALIMPQKEMTRDLKAFGAQRKWNESDFLSFLNRYDATPEMVLQRMTTILPTFFNVQNLFFLRFLHSDGKFSLTRELHLPGAHNPHANELNEHYCRRWIATSIISELEKDKDKNGSRMIAKAQISEYHDSPNAYCCFSIAFPNVSNPSESMSVTIGFLMDKALGKWIKFLDDPAVDRKAVNVTCERCVIADCKERMAQPIIVGKQSAETAMLADIEEILKEKQ